MDANSYQKSANDLIQLLSQQKIKKESNYTADFLIHKLAFFNANLNPDILFKSQFKFIKQLYQFIEKKDPHTAHINKILSIQGEKFIDEYINSISSPAARNQLIKCRQKHINKMLAYPLKKLLNQFALKSFPSSAIIPVIIKGAIFAYSSDKKIVELKKLYQAVIVCRSLEDYQKINKLLTAKINDHHYGYIHSVLKLIQKNILNTVLNTKSSKFLLPDQKNAIQKSNINYKNKNNNLIYFQHKFEQQFIYRVVGHGISNTQLFKRQAGVLGNMGKGIELLVRESKVPGVPIISNALTQTLQAYENYYNHKQDQKVTKAIDYEHIQAVARQLSRKITYRYAFQVQQLYASESYTVSLDKMINFAINALLKFSDIDLQKLLAQKSADYKKEYDYLSYKHQQNRLSNAEQKSYLTLQADLIADQLLQGLTKKSLRICLGGSFTLGESSLIHQKDKASLISRKKWHLNSIYDKPGYALVSADQHSIEFYRARNSHSSKYGYRFITRDEFEKIEYLLKKENFTDHQYTLKETYLKLHQEIKATMEEQGAGDTAAVCGAFNAINNPLLRRFLNNNINNINNILNKEDFIKQINILWAAKNINIDVLNNYYIQFLMLANQHHIILSDLKELKLNIYTSLLSNLENPCNFRLEKAGPLEIYTDIDLKNLPDSVTDKYKALNLQALKVKQQRERIAKYRHYFSEGVMIDDSAALTIMLKEINEHEDALLNWQNEIENNKLMLKKALQAQWDNIENMLGENVLLADNHANLTVLNFKNRESLSNIPPENSIQKIAL